MKRVYTADNRAMAWHVKNILDSYSVESEVRNDILHSAQGPVPVNECNPEVWILHDSDEETARRLIEETLASSTPDEASWQCDNCGEINYGQFDLCWNCQSEATRPQQ